MDGKQILLEEERSLLKTFIQNNGLKNSETCPCGSEKPFVQCCLKKASFHDTQEVESHLQSTFSKAMYGSGKLKYKCLYKSCRNAAINSHLYSVGMHIKLITGKNGQIRKYTSAMRNGHRVLYNNRLQRKDATTFKGFCSFHDNHLFSSIDNHFVLNEITINPMAYRCVGAKFRRLEYLYLNILYDHFSIYPQLYSNQITSENQVWIQSYLIGIMRELTHQLELLETLLRNIEKNYLVKSAEWTNSHPVLRVSDPVFLKVKDPRVLYNHTQMLVLDKTKRLLTANDMKENRPNYIMTMVFPDQRLNGVHVVFVAPKSSDPVCHSFIDNMNEADEKEIHSILNYMILRHLNSFYFSEDMEESFEISDRNLENEDKITLELFDQYDFENIHQNVSKINHIHFIEQLE